MANPADDRIQLNALIDDELDGVVAGRIRRRLAESTTLQDEYRSTKALCELLNRWDKIDCRHVSASPSYQAKLLERLRRLKASERNFSTLVITFAPASRN